MYSHAHRYQEKSVWQTSHTHVTHVVSYRKWIKNVEWLLDCFKVTTLKGEGNILRCNLSYVVKKFFIWEVKIGLEGLKMCIVMLVWQKFQNCMAGLAHLNISGQHPSTFYKVNNLPFEAHSVNDKHVACACLHIHTCLRFSPSLGFKPSGSKMKTFSRSGSISMPRFLKASTTFRWKNLHFWSLEAFVTQK